MIVKGLIVIELAHVRQESGTEGRLAAYDDLTTILAETSGKRER